MIRNNLKRLTVNSLAVLVATTGMTALSIADAGEAHAFSGSQAVKPIANNVHQVSSNFGYRIHPISKVRKMHYGTDYRAKCGEPLVSTEAGTITRNSMDRTGYGWWVEITHKDKKTRYAHMQAKSPLKVGTKVHRGQSIGKVGTTGGSTGCHLHFETLKPNGTRVNPANYVKGAQRVNAPLTVKTPVKEKWRLGSHGDPQRNLGSGLKSGGSFQKFDKGSIHHSKKTGAHFTEANSPIQKKWAAQKYENGELGYPSSDPLTFKYEKGTDYQNFEGGMVTADPQAGTHIMKGNIQKKWKSMGWERSAAKLPRTDEKKLSGGAFQHFEGGSIHWSPKTGAHFTKAGSAIQRAWADQKWEKGALGYPTSDEYKSDGKIWQDFEGGKISWTSAEGTQVHKK